MMIMDSWKEESTRPIRHKRFRRAQTACHRCRAKKTKCDNRRPSCGVCVENHAQCVYGELDRGQQGHEPTMREVFDRLDQIANLLELDGRPPSYSSTATGSQLLNPSLSPPAAERTSTLPASLNPCRINQSSVPAGISFESTLKWPVFQDFTPSGITSLVMQGNPSKSNNHPSIYADERIISSSQSTIATGIGELRTPLVLMDENNIRSLCQRYLTVVHVKNPIFEVSEFNRHVKKVLKTGLDWSEDSCVVMLACALASTVKQVRESFDCATSPLESPHHPISDPFESRPLSSDAYYLASKRRLGLLDVTLTSVQCFFLAGLYEMCRMNPANAWVHYSQACSRLLLILSQDDAGDEQQNPNFHVLERLYFSCCRTELDLREELQLPPSGITNLEFPREFPSLPSWTSFRSSLNQIMSNTVPTWEVLPPHVMRQQEEKSWYYYLACIALRKEANSIIDLLYRPGVQIWMDNIEHVISQAALQEHELDQLQNLLPASLKFDPDDGAPEDLALILECRQLQWRQVSYRPLLYYILHRPESDPYFHRVLPLAQKCLHYCALTIKRLLRPHHCEATWFIQRSIATATLLVLAAQIRGPPLYVPSWHSLVASALRALSIRKATAPDLDRAHSILERTLDEVTKHHERNHLGATLK